MQAHNPAEDGLALVSARTVLCHDPRPNLNLLTDPQDAREYGPAGDAALELMHLGTGLVDVEGADDDETGIGGEVADGDRDALDDVLEYGVNVVFELSGYGDDGR